MAVRGAAVMLSTVEGASLARSGILILMRGWAHFMRSMVASSDRALSTVMGLMIHRRPSCGSPSARLM